MEKVQNIPNIRLHTSLKPEFGGAIGLVEIEGKKAGKLTGELFRDYKIHTTNVVWENLNGVRITPNVYTTTNELDVLVEALKAIAQA